MSSENKLLTIITICYNSEKTIRDTLNSVIKQVDQEFEYIIIDGGSNDGTIEIIKSFKRCDKFISEKDKGLYDALNKGVMMSTGNFIGILHSDDIFNNNNSISIIKKSLEGSYFDSHIFNAIQINQKGKTVRKLNNNNWSRNKLYSGFMPSHISTIYSRNVFIKYGLYNYKYIICGDYEHAVRLFLKKNISYKKHNEIITKMRIGGKSTSGLKSYYIISKEICNSFDDNNLNYNKLRIWLRLFLKLNQLINY